MHPYRIHCVQFLKETDFNPSTFARSYLQLRANYIRFLATILFTDRERLNLHNIDMWSGDHSSLRPQHYRALYITVFTCMSTWMQRMASSWEGWVVQCFDRLYHQASLAFITSFGVPLGTKLPLTILRNLVHESWQLLEKSGLRLLFSLMLSVQCADNV